MKQITISDNNKKNILNTDFDHFQSLKSVDENTPVILREIKKKYLSYKGQDKIKHKFDKEKHITFDELIEKLIECELKCYYCKKDMLLLYNKKRESNQWSLERFNNNIGHYKENTCIACLGCNLGRRTDNHEYYKKGKQMILIKEI